MASPNSARGNRLVNCTPDNLYVQVGTEFVLLESAQAPQTVHATTQSETLPVTTSGGVAPIVLESHGQEVVTTNVPALSSGTSYIVAPEVLACFGYREDFLVVSGYRVVNTSEGDSRIVVDKVSSAIPVATVYSTEL